MTAPAITTYAEAITARSTDEIAAALMDDLATAGVDMTGFGAFSVQMALPQLEAAALNALENLRVKLVKAGVPTTAAEAGSDWVDITLNGFFQEPRIQAIKAEHILSLSTLVSGAGPYPIKVGEIIAQDDGSAVTFENVDAATIPHGSSVPVRFRARVAGAIGNSAQGGIDHLVVGKPGVSVFNYNGSLALGGRDAETDAQYLIRCLGKWGTLGAGGNAIAYHYLVPRAAPTITRIMIRDDNPFGPGSIGLCLANAAGPATLTEVQAVANALVPIKPLGSGPLVVFAASAQTVEVSAVLFGSNANAVSLATAVLAKLAAEYPIGGPEVTKVYRAKIIEILMEIPGMRTVNVTKPSGDVALAPYSVIQITPTLGTHP